MPKINGWFRPSTEVQRMWIRSRVQPFPSHFVPGVGHARCPLLECALCEYSPREDHGLIVVQVGANRELQLLELRPRHEFTLREARELGDEIIGTPIFTWIDANEHGNPIEISFDPPAMEGKRWHTNKINIKAVPCERYCEAIGKREYQKAIANWGLIEGQLRAAAQLTC